jgi:RimJ/RimL family protein N-acetyltransferase
MLRLRSYKRDDARVIVSWISDEFAFRQWSADRYERWPVTAADVNANYDACMAGDSFFALTAEDEKGTAGHLTMRWTDEEKTILRFGFIIVNSERRGQGLGHEMLRLALRHAFDALKAEKVTLAVFKNNEPAYRCYKAAGFKDVPSETPERYHVLGEVWTCREMECLP